MRIIFIVACLFLAACSATPEPVAPAETTQSEETESDTEMRDAIQAPIEKAKQVEDQVIDGAEKQKAEIEAAGG